MNDASAFNVTVLLCFKNQLENDIFTVQTQPLSHKANLGFDFVTFQRKQVTCKFHVKQQALFSLKNKKKNTIKLVLSKYLFITKTRLYNSDPLKPHFYIVKLGFTGVYIIFLISAQKHRSIF